jgi:CRISPR-associated protein Csm3
MSNYCKIEITARLELKTGLHIGGSSAFAAIGATDSPVIKDALTNRPLIPGSSIKGKMRSLLARALNETAARNPNEDHPQILRLFGASNPKNIRGRLVFSDLVMSEAVEKVLRERGAKLSTEVKFENTINRITGVANPRQIERVIAGSWFDFSLMYEFDDEENSDDAQIREDFKNIGTGFKLLEYDYLGGSGTRGYGKVVFSDIRVKSAVGQPNTELLEQLEKVLSGVSSV